ncbi:hypothetical protein SETIT_2G025000v2 [Setaria italica]|uniref:DUF4220 domain-containing protein n=1 Tax=Setaria italica TaxID=4555 RepID=A0A368PUD0_SETIT|nr:hypothetical protein SETIT_2G025000v2 [Setaria italica]
MQKLRARELNQNGEPPVGEDAPPPPLLVMREEEKQVEMQPSGYAFKDDSGTMVINNNGLAGAQDRVFGLIANELSFLHDYYYSSLPISYSKCCMPILSIFLSLLTIGCIAATYLSRYCAYLVTWCPELLPDNNAWSKSLYDAVKKDARRALASHAAIRSSTPEDEYQKLVELLGANSKHEVLKKGVKLGKHLAETIDDEETAWKLLADFWSEMILYIAPSEDLKGHKEAIARGGELITLLWAMLFHAGIVNRPGEEDGAASTYAATV